jgi:hypothetical protein
VKRSPIKSKRKRLSVLEREAQQAWGENPEPCVSCRQRGLETVGTQPHHAIYKQRIRRWVESMAYELRFGPGEISRLLAIWCWDLRNRVWLCESCHTNHHSRFSPLPQVCLPDSVWQFAADIGMTGDLERDYVG